MERFERDCACCGDTLEITVDDEGNYEGGHFWDILPKDDEYWECDRCYHGWD